MVGSEDGPDGGRRKRREYRGSLGVGMDERLMDASAAIGLLPVMTEQLVSLKFNTKQI